MTTLLVEALGVLRQDRSTYPASKSTSELPDKLPKRHEQRRHIAKARLPVNDLGQLAYRAQMVLAPRTRERSGEPELTLAVQPATELLDELAGVQALIPDVEMAHPGEPSHRRAILPDAVQHDPPPAILGQVDVPAGDLGARGHPLDVPLPRPGQRLVEVVGAEQQVSVRRREAAEVGDVRVPTGLNDDPGTGRARQVRCHHGGRAAVERERADEHSPVADRNQRRHTLRRLLLQDLHRVTTVGRRHPVGVRRPRDILAQREPALGRLTTLQP